MSYTALVLDKESHERLLAKYRTLPIAFGHHMTVMLGTKVEDVGRKAPFFKSEDVGKTFDLQVVGLARSEQIEAVVVAVLKNGEKMMDGVSTNKIPHITIATDGNTKPFKSNELLKGDFQTVENGMMLCSTLCIVED